MIKAHVLYLFVNFVNLPVIYKIFQWPFGLFLNFQSIFYITFIMSRIVGGEQ